MEHLHKKASERSSAMAQPIKPAMHKVHEHGGVLRSASVATPYGNAVGAGQPMVIGPAKATGPAHPQHAAICKMDQQPMPLPCEVAPSVMSMTGSIVKGSIRLASVGHANQRPAATPSCARKRDTRQRGGLNVILRLTCSPSIPRPVG